MVTATSDGNSCSFDGTTTSAYTTTVCARDSSTSSVSSSVRTAEDISACERGDAGRAAGVSDASSFGCSYEAAANCGTSSTATLGARLVGTASALLPLALRTTSTTSERVCWSARAFHGANIKGTVCPPMLRRTQRSKLCQNSSKQGSARVSTSPWNHLAPML
jgi:hypothetical protein